MSASADESADAPKGSSPGFPAYTRFLPFVLFALLTIAVMGALLFVDVPLIEHIFVPTIPVQGS